MRDGPAETRPALHEVAGAGGWSGCLRNGSYVARAAIRECLCAHSRVLLSAVGRPWFSTVLVHPFRPGAVLPRVAGVLADDGHATERFRPPPFGRHHSTGRGRMDHARIPRPHRRSSLCASAIRSRQPGRSDWSGGSARSGKSGAPTVRSGMAAGAAALLLAVAGCGGGAEAPETVSPTAGADPAPSDQIYEPTLPPYTSEVDLSAEETQQVEELLLLIDEFNLLTGTLTEDGPDRASTLAGSVQDELLESHIEGMKETLSEGIRTRGQVVPKSAVVLKYGEGSAVVSVCYDFSQYEIYDVDDPETPLYPDRPDEHAYDTTAKANDDSWLINDRFDSEVTCEDH